MRRATLLAVLVASLAACNGGTVDRHALKQDSEAIDSLACEGALLANDAGKGATTHNFVEVHAGELAQRASNFADALSERPTLPAIERDVRAEGRKAGVIAGLLDQLHEDPDRPVAESLRDRLEKQGGCS
ncbi:MAG TPA: hypothetical protein VN960_08200 [Gaiellaceae bacterium]|nr:hypothetical protein [Gaiellaceae bacterium]